MKDRLIQLDYCICSEIAMNNTEQTHNAPGILFIYKDKTSLSHVPPKIRSTVLENCGFFFVCKWCVKDTFVGLVKYKVKVKKQRPVIIENDHLLFIMKELADSKI